MHYGKDRFKFLFLWGAIALQHRISNLMPFLGILWPAWCEVSMKSTKLPRWPCPAPAPSAALFFPSLVWAGLASVPRIPPEPAAHGTCLLPQWLPVRKKQRFPQPGFGGYEPGVRLRGFNSRLPHFQGVWVCWVNYPLWTNFLLCKMRVIIVCISWIYHKP